MSVRQLCIGISFCCVAWIPLVQAYDLPPLNLGLTSYLDAYTIPPGFHSHLYLAYYDSDRLTENNGDTVRLPTLGGLRRAEVDGWITVLQGVYQSDRELIFGSQWGITAVLPFTSLDLSPGNSPAIREDASGVGDLLIGPYLQFSALNGPGGPRLMQRVELSVIFPTGQYDNDYDINPGSNFLSLNPYWSGTFIINEAWTASWRLHYLWNAENDDPSPRAFPGADDVQAGQAVHLNFATSFSVIPNRLRLGINGYYLKQISDTEVDGVDAPGRREQVFGIGPGAVLFLSPKSFLVFTSYFESHAENRTEGFKAVLRFTHSF